MSFKNILFSLLIFVSLTLSAQNTGIIRGQLKDKNTQEVIIGGTVVIEGTTIGTSTDIDGNFKIVIPVGTYNVKAQYIGYTPLIKYNIAVSSGNAQFVNFEINMKKANLPQRLI